MEAPEVGKYSISVITDTLNFVCVCMCVSAGSPTPQSIELVVTSTPDPSILVSWDPAQGAEHYVALSLTGQNCSSSTNSCTLIPLSCGETNSVTVIAVNQAGNSVPSYPVQIISCE